MSDFTVRVELHGASGEDYERLHAEMYRHGFKRYIVGDGGSPWVLPTAEYDFSSTSLSTSQVRDLAFRVASSVHGSPQPWVLTTKANGRAWIGQRIDVPAIRRA